MSPPNLGLKAFLLGLTLYTLFKFLIRVAGNQNEWPLRSFFNSPACFYINFVVICSSLFGDPGRYFTRFHPNIELHSSSDSVST